MVNNYNVDLEMHGKDVSTNRQYFVMRRQFDARLLKLAKVFIKQNNKIGKVKRSLAVLQSEDTFEKDFEMLFNQKLSNIGSSSEYKLKEPAETISSPDHVGSSNQMMTEDHIAQAD